MSSVLALGLRLAWGSRGQRLRSVAVAVASALGVASLLLVWAVARDRLLGAGTFQSEVDLVIAGVLAVVALPVVAMVATVAKLQTREREARLANLRRLGLSASRTRLVAGVEVGVASVTGVLLGIPLFRASSWLVRQVDVAGQPWSPWYFTVPLLGWVTVLVGVPAVAIVVAVWPSSESGVRDVSAAEESRGPGWWRLLPLLAGLGACAWVVWRPVNDYLSDAEAYAYLGAIALAAVGLLIAAPVLVRLVALLAVKVARGPGTTIAARRLQARPGAVLRVVATLMAVLVVLAGAPGVMADFESVGQYKEAERSLTEAQTAEVVVSASAAPAMITRLEATPGIDDVVDLSRALVTVDGQSTDDEALVAVIATCDDLAATGAEVPGCVEGRVLVGDSRPDLLSARTAETTPLASADEPPTTVSPSLDLSNAVTVPAGDLFDWRLGDVHLVIPPTAPGIAELVAVTQHSLVVLAPPGRDLMEKLDAAEAAPFLMFDVADYDFGQGIFFLARLITGLLLLLGTFALAVAMVDRAAARRQENASLRMLGTPSRVLRRAQGIEALVPLLVGGVSAVLVGWLGGNAWLSLVRETDLVAPPWALLLGVVVASFVVAVVTLVGAGVGTTEVGGDARTRKV